MSVKAETEKKKPPASNRAIKYFGVEQYDQILREELKPFD